MALMKLVPLLVLTLFAAESYCLTIGPFEKVTDNSLFSRWDDGVNDVTYETDGMYMRNTVWLSGLRYDARRRAYSMSIAELKAANNTWKTYMMSSYGGYLFKVFTLAGQLFMFVTYSEENKVARGVLLAFDHTRQVDWFPASLESPDSLCSGSARYSDMSVSISNSTGNTAYIGVSCYGTEGGTKMEFHKLTVDTSGERVKAQITTLATKQSDGQEPLSHIFDRNGIIYVITGQNRSDCYTCLRDEIYTVAAGSNELTSNSVIRPNNVPSWIRVNKAVQLDNYALFFGGRVSNPVNNGKRKSVEDERQTIRALNLDTLEWSDTNVELPSEYQPILDQAGKRLFAVSIRNGVKVARISL